MRNTNEIVDDKTHRSIQNAIAEGKQRFVVQFDCSSDEFKDSVIPYYIGYCGNGGGESSWGLVEVDWYHTELVFEQVR